MIPEGIRGDDQQQSHMFSYLSLEAGVRKDHPLHAIRVIVDEVLSQLSRRFDAMYARVGRPSIMLEKLLQAQLLQMLYSGLPVIREWLQPIQPEFLLLIPVDCRATTSS